MITGTGLIKSTGLISGSPTAITSMGLTTTGRTGWGRMTGSGTMTGSGRMGSGRTTGSGTTTTGPGRMGSGRMTGPGTMMLSASSTTIIGSTTSIGVITVSGPTGACKRIKKFGY